MVLCKSVVGTDLCTIVIVTIPDIVSAEAETPDCNPVAAEAVTGLCIAPVVIADCTPVVDVVAEAEAVQDIALAEGATD